ncbi:MAG: CvpA family protein [Pontiellaceae bacterium]|nr:CvpA family protein [Pontiellaceae bacterium]
MDYVIDILVLIILILQFRKGWQKGPIVAGIGIARIFISIIAAYFAGRYLGYWLGAALHRPRIVIIPATAGLTFVLLNFGISIYMWRLQEKRRIKKEKGEMRAAWFSSTLGGAVNAVGAILPLILIFWLAELVATGATGHSFPGATDSRFGAFSRRALYETIYFSLSKTGNESQAAAIAAAISNPDSGLNHLKSALESSAIQNALKDDTLTQAIQSGEVSEIERNRAFRTIFSDRRTRSELIDLGIIDRNETPHDFAQKLAVFGQNENIRFSIKSLYERDLLQKSKILLLIRDPEFDAILEEMMSPKE